MAKDDILNLVIGIAVIGGAAYAIHAGYLGKAVDALLNLKLPGLPGGGGTGNGGGGDGSGNGGGGTGNGGGGGTVSGDSFAAAGDWGSGRNNKWQSVVSAMEKLKPSVGLIPGDMSYTNVADFKKVTDGIKKFANKVYGANGNHDGGGYATLFDGYSNSVVNVGQMSIMLLDTEKGSASVTFGKANLSKMTGKFKIVVFHKPIVTSPSDHKPDEGGIKALVPEFEKAKVNLVIQAHNHNYQRFSPKNGVTYTVVGTGGEGLYKLKGSGSGVVKQDDKTFGFLYGKVVNSVLQCKFISTGGATVDSFNV